MWTQLSVVNLNMILKKESWYRPFKASFMIFYRTWGVAPGYNTLPLQGIEDYHKIDLWEKLNICLSNFMYPAAVGCVTTKNNVINYRLDDVCIKEGWFIFPKMKKLGKAGRKKNNSSIIDKTLKKNWNLFCVSSIFVTKMFCSLINFRLIWHIAGRYKANRSFYQLHSGYSPYFTTFINVKLFGNPAFIEWQETWFLKPSLKNYACWKKYVAFTRKICLI